MFTLKVTRNLEDEFIPYDVSEYGGIDLKQRFAFEHLFPLCYCPAIMGEVLYLLATLHGWKVECIKTVKK